MTDYIDRQTAVDAVNQYISQFDAIDVNFLDGLKTAINIVKKLPSVDAVEVVRCADCKYFDSGTDEDGKLFFKCLGWVYGGTSEDDFCSHGERNDG